MNTFKTGERFRGVVRCNIIIKYRRGQTEMNISLIMGKDMVSYDANDILAHSTTAW